MHSHFWTAFVRNNTIPLLTNTLWVGPTAIYFYSILYHLTHPKFFFPFPSLFIITHPFFSFSNNNLHEWSSPPSSLTLHFPNPNYIILFIIYGIMLLILSSLKPMPKRLLWTQTHSKSLYHDQAFQIIIKSGVDLYFHIRNW